jgi:hypothetical protein
MKVILLFPPEGDGRIAIFGAAVKKKNKKEWTKESKRRVEQETHGFHGSLLYPRGRAPGGSCWKSTQKEIGH